MLAAGGAADAEVQKDSRFFTRATAQMVGLLQTCQINTTGNAPRFSSASSGMYHSALGGLF